jgi:tetratricopeptide (TPR) repeat protein
VLDLDFSNERFVQDLVETAHDQGLLADERMNAFFLLGAVDFGLGRYPQALEKYGICFNYFDSQGNGFMKSLCLLGAADTTRQAGRPEESLKFYQQSLALGMDQQSVPVIQQRPTAQARPASICSETRMPPAT